MTCENFPGAWKVPDSRPDLTCRFWVRCECESCQADWPCPIDLKPGQVIEVGTSLGIYPAEVLKVYQEDGKIDIASNDGAAPRYLRDRVHEKWLISTRNEYWRLWDPERAWVDLKPEPRYERKEVIEVDLRYESLNLDFLAVADKLANAADRMFGPTRDKTGNELDDLDSAVSAYHKAREKLNVPPERPDVV